MRKYLVLLFFTVFSCFQFTISAQNDTIWYDKEWNETIKFHAEFYRPKPLKKKGKYIIKDYFIDGKLQMEGASVEQDTMIFDGEVLRYYQNGLTQSIVNYKNGKLNGPATEYFEDGTIQRIIPFENGLQNGVYKEYYSNGQLRGTIEYKNDVMDGAYKEFHENGNKKTIQVFKEGEKNGDYLEYYSDGNVRYSGRFENGILQGETKMYDSDGNLKNSGHFIDNQKHGVWTSVGYYDTEVTRTYNKEILHGEMTFKMKRTEASAEEHYKGYGMYENGKLISWTLEKLYKNNYKPYRVMTIENDKVKWKNYHENGELYSESSYGEYSIEDGNWKFYYSNGKLKHDITFLAKGCYDKMYDIEETVIESVDDYAYNEASGSPGVPSGYLPDGLIKQETFNYYYDCEASAQGEYTHYYKNGKPKLKATFKDGKLVGQIIFFNKSNKKDVYNLNTDTSNINALIKVTPIKTESYVELDYTDVEPSPFEIIIYYEDYYGTSKIKNAVVHPILKSYLTNLAADNQIFTEIRNSLNNTEGINFEYNNFRSKLYYSLEAYKDFMYQD